MLIGLFGTGRNGSTLIGRLLDGLQDTYVHPVEENFLSKLNDLARAGRLTALTSQNCTAKPLRNLGGKLPAGILAQHYQESLDTLYEKYVKGCAKTRGLARPKPEEWLTQGDYAPAEFVPAYLMGAAGYVRPDLGFKHCLFKSIETPYLANYVAQFPAMKFVHIVRHPVPVCSSQKRSLFENKKLPGSHIGLDWLVCMMKHRWLPHARFIAEHQYDPRHIVVRYESLVSDPNGEISRVAKALGLAPPARPDEQTVFYDQGVDDWGHNPSKPGVKTPNKAVANLQEKYGYQEILSKREIDLILYKASPYLTALGYPQAEPVAFSSLLWESLLPDQWELMHCRTLRLKGRAVLAILNRRSFLLS